jgi:hypothetical protein
MARRTALDMEKLLGRMSWVALAGICTVAIAACGSSNKPGSAGRSLANTMVSYSRCMRTHGVTGFPDPSNTQGPNAFGIDGYNFNLPATLNTQSPAYKTANQTCQKVISTATGSGRGLPARAKQAALAHAECMRQHGVPNYPDPTFSQGGGGLTVSSGSSAANAQSPAFQRAQKDCAKSGQ